MKCGGINLYAEGVNDVDACAVVMRSVSFSASAALLSS